METVRQEELDNMLHHHAELKNKTFDFLLVKDKNLKAAKLENCIFESCDIDETSLREASIDKCIFRNCYFRKSSLDSTVIRTSTFSDCTFAETHFLQADVQSLFIDCKFILCHLSKANFSNSFLSFCMLDYCHPSWSDKTILRTILEQDLHTASEETVAWILWAMSDTSGSLDMIFETIPIKAREWMLERFYRIYDPKDIWVPKCFSGTFRKRFLAENPYYEEKKGS